MRQQEHVGGASSRFRQAENAKNTGLATWSTVLALLLILLAVAALVAWLLLDRHESGTETPATGPHHGAAATHVTAHTPRTVTATITFAGAPGGLAVDPVTHTAYVTVCTRCGGVSPLPPGDGNLSVIDTTTNTVTKTIDVALPLDVAVDSTTHTAYVTGSYWGRNRGVSVVDATAGVITAGIDVRGGDIVIDSTTQTAYIGDGGDHVPGRVSVVDLATNTVRATIESDTAGPACVGVDPAIHTAYLADYSGTVSVIDPTDTVTATIEVGAGPMGVAVDSSTHTAYVTRYPDVTVSVIDTATNTVTATIDVGAGPDGVAVDSGAHTGYVTNNKDGTVSVIDTTANTVTATVKVGNRPSKVAVDPQTHTAYVTNDGDGTVSVIAPSPGV